MLLLAGGESGRAEAPLTSVWVQLLGNACVHVEAVWGRKVRVAPLRCVLFSHPCWLQTMSWPYLDCNVTYTLKTAATEAPEPREKAELLFLLISQETLPAPAKHAGSQTGFGTGTRRVRERQ